MDQYNEILGIHHNVSAEELKVCYRKRAKILHPDRNPGPGSHEQFVLLHEAYEFYKDLLLSESGGDPTRSFNTKKYPSHYYNDKWNAQKRQEARKRAAEKAKMKYRDFERKGYYKILNKMNVALDVARIIFALFLFTVLPYFTYVQEGILGLVSVLVIQGITYPLWSRAFKRFL